MTHGDEPMFFLKKKREMGEKWEQICKGNNEKQPTMR